MRVFGSCILCLLQVALGQQAGDQKEEGHPPLQFQRCDGNGCQDEQSMLTLDASRRWLHDSEQKNCYEGDHWDGHICPDSETCAKECYLEGVTAEEYSKTYGVNPVDSGLEIKFVTPTDWGSNVGSRLYVLETDDKYKTFQLKNKEMAFDVDLTTLPCGLNAAVYLVEMSPTGGMNDDNKAGAKFGTGYCDAFCPKTEKFVNGEANLKNWKGAIGGEYGSCCQEMDLFEANKVSSAFTGHPCDMAGPFKCTGVECGDTAKGYHYQGVCDRDGCDFNPYRNGDTDYYGAAMVVDTSKVFTVVTQFLTVDGTDGTDLAEVRRFFKQDDKVIAVEEATKVPGGGNSLTNAYCAAQKEEFHKCRVENNPQGALDQFNKKGGLKTMGEALERGMVLAVSLWDDPATSMHWLDSASPDYLDESEPGVKRGTCGREEGKSENVRKNNADAFVRFTNFKYGEIGTTTPGVSKEPVSPLATAPLPDQPFSSAETSTDGMVGGGSTATADAGVDGVDPSKAPGTFDCFAGYSNWVAGWSDAKKQYCCTTKQMGCAPDEAAVPLATDPAAVPMMPDGTYPVVAQSEAKQAPFLASSPHFVAIAAVGGSVALLATCFAQAWRRVASADPRTTGFEAAEDGSSEPLVSFSRASLTEADAA